MQGPQHREGCWLQRGGQASAATSEKRRAEQIHRSVLLCSRKMRMACSWRFSFVREEERPFADTGGVTWAAGPMEVVIV